MDRKLQNKVVVITGGGGGIGSALADEFLSKNAKTVILLDTHEDNLKTVSDKLNSKYGANKAVYIKCDVITDLKVISQKILDDYQTVDVLVNCAGIFAHKHMKKVIDLNTSAVIEWSTVFYEHMRKDKGGKGGTIFNVASVAGFTIDQHASVYRASKSAVVAYTRSLGHVCNYNKSGVRVIAICPGYTDTNLVNNSKAQVDEDAKKIIDEAFEGRYCQSVKVVQKAAAEIFENANSGTIWEVAEDKPVIEVLYSVKYAS